MMRAALRSVLIALALTACAHGAATKPEASTPFVLIVRHAEKATAPANDPVLSESGIARAAALDAMIGNQPVRDVVVSHLQRTRLTAAAFIARTAPVVHVVPIGAAGAAAHVQAVADTVRAIARSRGRGGILVVGHSNTVTQIVTALGAGTPAQLCDSQYSQVFRVVLAASGAPALSRTTYGAADPADATCAQSERGMLDKR